MSTENSTLPALLDDRAVSRLLGLSVATTRKWRILGRGPRFIKVGRAIRYRADELRSWLESRPAGGG